MGGMLKNLKEYGFKTDNKFCIVAEIGINHGGSIENAKKLIKAAADAGADAVKFQTYITEKRAAKDSKLFGILKKCELPFAAFKELKDFSLDEKIDFFSTPFDEESVDLLESLDCQIYKIASFDVTNKLLLSKVANTRKAVILAVGMANLGEIQEALNIITSKTRKVSILHCVSAYPAQEIDANLGAIYTLKSRFDCVVGQSDHTNGILAPLYAAACGAQIIEKHFMLDGKFECVDKPVSITSSQMKKLVSDIRGLEQIIGDGEVGITDCQLPAMAYRRYSNL